MFIIAGTFLLTLLCLLTPAIWRSEAILVAGAITGGALFYLVLLQIPLTGKVFTQLLTILWGASLLECGVFTLQYLHLPLAQFWEFPWWRDARPYGIFQQVNLMASFTASGTLLSATLALRTGARCRIAIGAGMLLMGLCCMKASPRPDICHCLSAGFCCCVAFLHGGGWQDYCCS